MSARDLCATSMSPEQIAEAQRLAREWEQKHKPQGSRCVRFPLGRMRRNGHAMGMFQADFEGADGASPTSKLFTTKLLGRFGNWAHWAPSAKSCP